MVSTPEKELFNGTLNTAAVVVAVFTALSLFNALELNVLVFFTFRRWRGVYFWSLTIAAISIIVYSIGFMLFYFQIGPKLAGMIVNNIGWITVCLLHTFTSSKLHHRYSCANIELDGVQSVSRAILANTPCPPKPKVASGDSHRHHRQRSHAVHSDNDIGIWVICDRLR